MSLIRKNSRKLIMLAILSFPLTALAVPVQFNFSGTFYSNNSPTALGVALAGQAFTGTITYDTSQPAQAQDFYYFPSQYKIDFYVGGNTIESDGFEVRDIPNSNLRFDGPGYGNPPGTLFVNGTQVLDSTAGFYFVFFADSQNTFASLPSSITVPGYGYMYDNNNQDLVGYTIDQISTVPEADTWAMLLAGLGLIGAVTRRQRTQI